jgi:glutamate synthase (NADPH/NADH) small chain
VTVEELRSEFDAVVLATGLAHAARPPAPGRELTGIHFAMDYLYGRNRWVASDGEYEPPITAAASTSSSSAAATPARTACATPTARVP